MNNPLFDADGRLALTALDRALCRDSLSCFTDIYNFFTKEEFNDD